MVVLRRYNAEITAGSLKVSESRAVARLLLAGASESDWKSAIVDQNVLQASRPASAIRVARLIRRRLEPMGPELWRLVGKGSAVVATHALLAAAIHHSALLGDFLDLVVREQLRIFSPTLSKRLWDEYLQGCRERDPGVSDWSDSTCRKCGTVIYHVLAQSGYIDDPRNLRLQAVHISTEVVDYLRANGHHAILRCMQVSA
jgi:hypothetical protein